jgi:hypothetical protein
MKISRETSRLAAGLVVGVTCNEKGDPLAEEDEEEDDEDAE